MKKDVITLSALLLSTLAFSQVGINTPDPRASLDITAKNATGTTRTAEGLLIPRVDRQRAQSMTGVETSTLIYVNNIATGTATGIAANINTVGYYYYDGTRWMKLKEDTSLYNVNGALTNNRTIAQGTNTLAFTSTATTGTDHFSVDGNTFSIDAANNRVGLGTSTPKNRLDLGSDAPVDVTAVEGKKLAIYNNATGNSFYGFGISSNTLQIHTASAPDGAPSMVLTRAGNVGIGNTEPSQKLTVVDGVNSNQYQGIASFLANNLTQGVGIGWGGIQSIGTLDNVNLNLNGKGTGNILLATRDTGNVGVGVINPKAKIDVIGTLGIRSGETSGSWDNLWLNVTAGTASVNASGAQSGLRFNVGNNATGTYGDEQTLTTVATMMPNGNMGIGTNAPSTKLHINSATNGAVRIADGTQGNNKVLTSDANGVATWRDLPATTDTSIYANNGTLTGNRTVSQAANSLAFTSTATTGANHFSIDGTTFSVNAVNDRVGIGTNAPSTKLHINSATNGAVRIADGTQGNNKVLTSDANGVATWRDLPATTDTSIYANNGTLTGNRTVSQAANSLAFTSTATTGTNHFSIDGTTFSVDAVNNRVGLGTSTPKNRLDLGSDAPVDVTAVEGKKLAIYNNATGTAFYGFGISDNTLQIHTASAPDGAPLMVLTRAGNVGIGNTEPSQKLTVVDGVDTNQYQGIASFLPKNLTQGVGIGWGGIQSIGTLDNVNLNLNGKGTGNILLATRDNGNVGIGTTNPTTKLDIAGSVKITDGTQGNNKVLTSDANGLATWRDLPATTDTSIYTNNGTLTGNRTVAQGANTLAFTGTAANAFSVDGTTFSVNAANDRVGIGTNAPNSTFQVVGGEVRIGGPSSQTGTTANPLLRIHSNANIDGSGGEIRFNENDSNYGYFIKHNTNAGTVNGNEGLAIGKLPLSNITKPGVFIAENQNIGLGTSTPQQMFHIDGGKDNNILVAPSETQQANDLVLTSEGRMGIGTTTPSTKLHINSAANGAVRIIDGTQGNNKVLTSDANGVATWKDLPATTDTSIYANNGTLTGNRTVSQAANSLAFTNTATTGTNHFSVDGTTFSVDAVNNRVGLGTSTPKNRLDLGSDAPVDVTAVEGKKLAIYNNATGTAFYGFGISDNTLQIHTASAPDGAPLMVLTRAGNVGIGNTEPSQKLTVVDGVDTNQYQGIASFLPKNLTQGVGIGWGGIQSIGTLDNVNLNLNGKGTGNILLATRDNGNVGIGTTNPTTKLDIAGSVKITDGTQGNNKVLTSDANGVATWKDLPATTDTSIYTNNGTLTGNRTVTQGANTLAFTSTATTGTNHFSVDGNTFSVDAANNRVGIGTTSPTTNLDVNGNVRLRSVPASNAMNSTDKIMVLGSDGVAKQVPADAILNNDDIRVIQYARSFSSPIDSSTPTSSQVSIGNLRVRFNATSPTSNGFIEYGVNTPNHTTVWYRKRGSLSSMIEQWGQLSISSTTSWNRVPGGSENYVMPSARDTTETIITLHNSKEIYRITSNINGNIMASDGVPGVISSATLFVEKLNWN